MRSIRKILLLIICGVPVLSYSQEHKVKVSVQSGIMYGGAIYNNELAAAEIVENGCGNWNVGADISCFFTKRFFAGVHFNHGNVFYTSNARDHLSDNFYRENFAYYGNMIINNAGLFAGYCLPISQSVNITGQVGFAWFFQLDNYPVIEYFPDKQFENGYKERYSHNISYFSSASFPVKFALEFSPFKRMNIGLARNIEIGYACGWYIEPDFGFFTGVYHGPQLSVSF